MQNLFEFELLIAAREQLYTNRTAKIHFTNSYQPTKPATQRDHLGIRKIEPQTKPKRNPNDTTNNTTNDTTNDTTNKNSPHANGTAAHPTTQDVIFQVRILFDI